MGYKRFLAYCRAELKTFEKNYRHERPVGPKLKKELHTEPLSPPSSRPCSPEATSGAVKDKETEKLPEGDLRVVINVPVVTYPPHVSESPGFILAQEEEEAFLRTLAKHMLNVNETIDKIESSVLATQFFLEKGMENEAKAEAMRALGKKPRS